MINKAVLVGRLTKNPEIKKTPNGNSVCSYTLAVGRNKYEEGQQSADFIECVSWGKTAENIYEYIKKGSLIGIEGHIQSRSYSDIKGNKSYVTEVVTDTVQFLEKKEN
ncbi:MAG: single-stranded DNA-binding protein [Holdemanella sp.]|nr:single-stranded DNA-binding protein [Holdemanella sp.]